MRGDMPKIIVERPRRGGGKLRREQIPRDDELALSKVGLRRHAKMRGGDKCLNENLAPLRRYLERQVGRPWNEVWSEICVNLKPSNALQQHVRNHVPDFVAIKTSLIKGEVWVHGRGQLVPLAREYARLYVDPASGILRRNAIRKDWRREWRAAQKAREAAIAARMRVVSRKTQLHLFGECWWEVTLAQAGAAGTVASILGPSGSPIFLGPDAVYQAGLSRLPPEELYGRGGVFAVAKRQLSRKEMRDLGLPRPH
jgi:hypothetical protein